MQPKAALLGLDWGTTSLRGYLIGTDGAVLAKRSEAAGILNVNHQDFSAVLAKFAGDWLTVEKDLPIIASGMIGSRQGWFEVPYAELPAGPAELAPVRFDDFHRPIHFIPGLAFRNTAGMPDVMRGEETQIAGAGGDGLYLLPGSHCKWVLVEDGRIVWFATFMTGELFAALKDHTILGRLMDDDADHDGDAFSQGVDRGNNGQTILQQLFSARTLALFGDLPESGVASYLSGLLIGAEIAEARAMADNSDSVITIIGTAALAARYGEALSHCGLESRAAPSDAAAAGQWRIAKDAGLLKA